MISIFGLAKLRWTPDSLTGFGCNEAWLGQSMHENTSTKILPLTDIVLRFLPFPFRALRIRDDIFVLGGTSENSQIQFEG